jgi:predicted DNA-binding transcriptional regulator AlpA
MVTPTTDDELIGIADVSRLTGLPPTTIRTYKWRAKKWKRRPVTSGVPLPDPDLTFGRSPVWRRSTIETWMQEREARATHIRAQCSICEAEGVDGIIHVKGCQGSTAANPLIMLDRWTGNYVH